MPHELVVRQVGVEGRDDPVAILPGLRAHLVVLEAVGFGKAGQVEPVLGPPLAIRRAGQQPIDQPLVGIGRLVVFERGQLFRRRRQAVQDRTTTAAGASARLASRAG